MSSDIARMVKKIMAPLERRAQLAIGRGVFSRLTKADGLNQIQIEGLAGEVIETDRPQPFGFKAHPVGGDAIFVCAGGNRDHALVIMVDDRSCPVPLAAGETCVYNADGEYAHFKGDGEIEVFAKQKIKLIAPLEVKIETAVLKVTGDIIDQCDSDGQSMQGMRKAFNDHTHRENGQGANTNTPNGLMGGA